MCVRVMSYYVHAWQPGGSGEGLGSPEAIVIGGCGPYYVFAGSVAGNNKSS